MLKGNRFSSKAGRFHQNNSKFGLGSSFNMKAGGSRSESFIDTEEGEDLQNNADFTEDIFDDIGTDAPTNYYSDDNAEEDI